jgi:hypothetical protein
MVTKPMQAPSAPQMPQQFGGVRMSVADEIQVMAGHFILIGLVLTSVYVSRIPASTLAYFTHPVYQFLGFVTIIVLTARYGWIHGILGALAFALVVSRALRQRSEGMTDYTPIGADQTLLLIEDSDTELVPKAHRWFLEKIMGENPVLIQEKGVSTSAVQDMSEKSMGSSTVTK